MSQKKPRPNEPCPCGSGKKAKRCCYRPGGENDVPGKLRSLYPIGTVAWYGPDNKTTTKIAAAVILDSDAEPILLRWMATDVTTNPKIKQEIQDFFDAYEVQKVVMSDGNLGCPHEEGEDFPLGEDCPFCPFWKGKQGTNRKQ